MLVATAGIESISNGASFGTQVKVFHDCSRGRCSVHQVQAANCQAPFALHIDAHEFDGDFLSVAIDLPEEAVAKLTRN